MWGQTGELHLGSVLVIKIWGGEREDVDVRISPLQVIGHPSYSTLHTSHWTETHLENSSCQRHVFLHWWGMMKFVSMGIQHTGIRPRKWRRVGERGRYFPTRCIGIPLCSLCLWFNCWKMYSKIKYLRISINFKKFFIYYFWIIIFAHFLKFIFGF